MTTPAHALSKARLPYSTAPSNSASHHTPEQLAHPTNSIPNTQYPSRNTKYEFTRRPLGGLARHVVWRATCDGYALYTCREPSTNSPLFCKTNPILSASGGFKTLYSTKDYENETAKNVPRKQTQNKPNLLLPNMNANLVPTKDYENEPRLHPPAKQTQFMP